MIDFSPGPSQLYPQVPRYLQDAIREGVPSISHRSTQFARIYASTTDDMRKLLDIPEDYHIWFLGSATEAMERIIQNLVKHRSHHFINGAFSAKFAKIADDLGRQTSQTEVAWGNGFDLLEHDIPHDTELIAITHNETSTGASIDSDELAVLHQRHPDILLAIDVVSSVPYVRLPMKAVDCAFFSVQKGFGLPAGLGVLVASPRALERSQALRALGMSVGSYHSFPELAANEAKQNTPETPNVLGIYLLGRVAADMLDMGISALRARLDEHANTLYGLIEEHPLLAPLVTQPRYRSRTVIVAGVPKGARGLIDDVKKHGHQLGTGYAHQKTTHIRIANFPSHIDHMSNLVATLRAIS